MFEQILIIGTGRLPCACLKCALANGIRVACIEPEKQVFSPLAALCRNHEVEYQLLTEKSHVSQALMGIEVNTLVVSAYNAFLFPEKVLASEFLSFVNFHNSLLPKHRGRNAPTWSIFEQDLFTGVTWHRVTSEIDKGEILAQQEIRIATDTSAWELTLATLEIGADVFGKLLPRLFEGKTLGKAPSSIESGLPHRKMEMPNNGRVDPGWSVSKLSAFLRSMDYGKIKVFPNPRVTLFGKEREVISYQLVHQAESKNEHINFDGRRLQFFSQGVGISMEVA